MRRVTEILSGKRAMLFDFDGPICGIFARHPAPEVAKSLRGLLDRENIELTPEVVSEEDPLEILKWAAAIGQPDVLERVEARLCREELEAAGSSEPTPFAGLSILAARNKGLILVVVSNNSEPAVQRYLSRHKLDNCFAGIVGRPYARPDLMKPNRVPMDRALALSGVPVEDQVMIGDSLTDIEAAGAVGIPVIALANRGSKVKPFIEAGADVVVTSMEPVVRALYSV